MSHLIIAEFPPSDGQQWECQCARCGSTCDWTQCGQCEDGFDGHDCGDDCCSCLDPEENVVCDICRGRGGWYRCMSSSEFCKANPLKGRESTQRGVLEWFVVEA